MLTHTRDAMNKRIPSTCKKTTSEPALRKPGKTSGSHNVKPQKNGALQSKPSSNGSTVAESPAHSTLKKSRRSSQGLSVRAKSPAAKSSKQARILPRFPAGPTRRYCRVKLPSEMQSALRKYAARVNLRTSHIIELAVADKSGWNDSRISAIRAHAEAHGRAA